MSEQPDNRRLSLTKAQLQTAAGAELLALCRSITADGKLSKEEIVALRKWLHAHRTVDLPAVGFLFVTLERIVADGKVTKEELAELHLAIEKVMPPEARKEAISHRREVQSEKNEQAKAQRAAEKDRERQERQAEKERQQAEARSHAPLSSWDFMVAGSHFEGRPYVIRRHVEVGQRVFLVRDRVNVYSKFAVEVRLENGMQIGFVPDEDAREMAPQLDGGCTHRASIKKLLTEGHSPIPIVQADLYRSEAVIADAVAERDVPAKVANPYRNSEGGQQGRSGCLSVILLGIAVLMLIATWL